MKANTLTHSLEGGTFRKINRRQMITLIGNGIITPITDKIIKCNICGKIVNSKFVVNLRKHLDAQ